MTNNTVCQLMCVLTVNAHGLCKFIVCIISILLIDKQKGEMHEHPPPRFILTAKLLIAALGRVRD